MSGVVIAGGGLAGAGAATLLARTGARVTVIEREAEPRDRICGEFLSIGAQRRLHALGLDPDALGAARIDRFRIVSGRRSVEARLPFVARGLTRRRLDAALLDHAAAAGAEVLRGVAVRAVEDGRLRTSVGEVAAPVLLVASGKHDLRGAARRTAGCEDGSVGFKTYWRLPPRARAALAGRVDVVLFGGGYAGLQLVEGGVANLCLNVRRGRLAAIGGWDVLLDELLRLPAIGAVLADAEPLLARPLTIAGVPYGYRHRAAAGEAGYRLGDQAAVIPSFCGDGMAMALATAFAAADAVAGGVDAARYHRRLRARFARQMRIAMALHRAGAVPALRAPLVGLLSVVPAAATLLAAMTRVGDGQAKAIPIAARPSAPQTT